MNFDDYKSIQALEEAANSTQVERINSVDLQPSSRDRVIVRYAASYHGNTSTCLCDGQMIRGYHSAPRISNIGGNYCNRCKNYRQFGAPYYWNLERDNNTLYGHNVQCGKCGARGDSVLSQETVTHNSVNNFSNNPSLLMETKEF